MSREQPVPVPTPEQRRSAASLFERAGQVVAAGDCAHAARLLLECCRIDPANLLYRQALRRAEKARYRNNLRGGWLAWLWNWTTHLRLARAVAAGRHLDVLELAERVLVNNPWDVTAQQALARSADALGLLDLAIWALEQARQKDASDAALNRELARLYERRGNFTQAVALWQRLHHDNPNDAEAGARLHQLSRHVPPASNAEMTAAGPVGPVEREALELRHALEEDPTRVAGYLALARLYRQAGRLEQAHSVLASGLGPTGHAFELSMEMADLSIEPFRRNLAITRDKLGEREDEGLRRIETELVKEINTRELDLYRLQADRFPDRPALRFEVGVRLLHGGQIDEALSELDAARRSPDIAWRAVMGIAHCHRARPNVKQALRHFEEALSMLPEAEGEARLEVLYELACCHAELGEYERAVERGGELAERSPGYRDVLQMLPAWQARARAAS